jgi:hypothetical protein
VTVARPQALRKRLTKVGREYLRRYAEAEAWCVSSMKFYKLAVGARFCVRGRRFEKLGMSMAEDEERLGHAFMGDVEVTPDGEALLLPPEVAARWKPDDRHWTEYVGPAPKQR